MKKLLIWFMTGWVSLSLTSCPGGECMRPKYDFSINLEVKPNTQIINLGDTLWLETKVSTQMQDLETGKMVDFSSAKLFDIESRIVRFKSLPNTSPEVEGGAFDFNYTQTELICEN